MSVRLHVAVAAWVHDGSPSGTSRRTMGLLRELAELLGPGETVTVLHSGTVPDDAPAGIRFHQVELPSAPTWRRVLAERRRLGRVLDSLGANVLELGSLPVPPKLPCPVSLTIHDLRDLDGWRRRPKLFVRRILKSSLRRVAHVTVPSQFTGDLLRRAVGGLLPPLKVIHGGVDSAFFHIERRRRDLRPYFLSVGHLERRKNPMLLLSAYAAMLEDQATSADSLPALFFAGADHGEKAGLVERAAMLDIVAHVHFLGAVPESQLHELYGGATALLMPSMHEGFGLPAVEGLAVGLPVLVADRGALPEVVGEAGDVLPAEDSGAWARAMSAAIKTSDDPALIALRRNRAKTFDWRAAAEQTVQVWREVARLPAD